MWKGNQENRNCFSGFKTINNQRLMEKANKFFLTNDKSGLGCVGSSSRTMQNKNTKSIIIVISNPTKSTKSFKNEFLYYSLLYSYCMLARFISQNKTHLSREHRPRKVGYFLRNKFSSQHSCIKLYSIKLSTEYVAFW